MDGTGKLFESFVENLGAIDFQIINFPEIGAQDYNSLAKTVSETLPSNEYIILAESFSGPLASNIVQEKNIHLKGIIFVTSFLSAPNRLALSIARFAPLKFLTRLPFSNLIQRHFMLGSNATKKCLSNFQSVVSSVPSKVLKARIKTMLNLVKPEFSSDLPVVYLSGDKDRLVPKSKIKEFENCFQNFTHKEISGPHFLLQACPESASRAVLESISLLTSQTSQGRNTACSAPV